MNALQNCRVVKILAPVSVAKATTATVTEIDTCPSGVQYNSMKVIVGVGVTDCGVSVLKLQAGDTSGSGWTDVTGLTATTLPSATGDGTHWVFDVSNLGARGRYWNLVLTTVDEGAAGLFTAYAILDRASQTPDTNTERGVPAGGYYVA